MWRARPPPSGSCLPRRSRDPDRPARQPKDIRFQILYRFACRSLSKFSIAAPSTPGAPLLLLTLCQAFTTRSLGISNALPAVSKALAPPLPMTLARSSQFLPETLADQHEHITNDPAPSLRPHYRSIITTTSRNRPRPKHPRRPTLPWNQSSRDQATARRLCRHPQGVQTQEGRQFRAGEVSLRHVEVSQLGCVAAPIIGGPRPLPSATTHPSPHQTDR